MKVNIILNEPVKNGSFADVKLSFTDIDGNLRTVPTTIDFRPLYDFSKDTTSVAFDFFVIGILIYCTDNLLERESYSIDGWAREIEVEFPVNNLKSWTNSKEKLEKILCFLTGDYWNISFKKSTIKNYYTDLKGRWKSNIQNFNQNEYTFVSLFSGGLDSLVGVIDGLEKLKNGEKALLISHFDGSSPGAKIDQERLNEYLYSNYKNKYDWLQEGVYLHNKDEDNKDVNKEPSFRSRSILFMAISTLCIDKTPKCNVLTVPENGTISLNYPLTKSRSSTLSTRTTHPFYITSLNELFRAIGLNVTVINPYDGDTKGELVKRCGNQAILKGIYKQSVSCGKRGRRMNWDVKSGTSHCGVCMPCIYRRAALHVIGCDNQLYGTDLFTTSKSISDITDMTALFDFLSRKLSKEDIKRTLLVNGSFDSKQLDKFADLVINVRTEIKQWIKDKGNDILKQRADIT
jgi:hypothetical protein